MRNKEQLSVVYAAMKAMNHTEFVLNFHHIVSEPGAPMDFGPRIQAMMRLCEEQHLDDRPTEHLRALKAIVDKLRDPLTAAEIKAAETNALRYEEWLSWTFPRAFDQMRKEASERTRKQALN